jgi:hypothetical protein
LQDYTISRLASQPSSSIASDVLPGHLVPAAIEAVDAMEKCDLELELATLMADELDCSSEE